MSNPSSLPVRLWGLWQKPGVAEAVGAVLVAVIGLPILSFPFQYDHGCFSALADVMLDGGTLYLDAWEHRPPLTYWTFYGAFLVFGREAWAPRLVDLLGLALTGAGLVALARSRFSSALVGLVAAATLALMYVPFGPECTTQSESFQLPLVVWALALLPKGPEEGFRVGFRCVWAGFLFGLAILYKPTTVFIPLAAFADRLWADRSRQGWRRLELAGWMAVGFLVPISLVSGYYALRGAAREYWDAIVTFSARYAALSLQRPLSASQETLRSLQWFPAIVGLMPGIVFAIGIVRGLWLKRTETLRWLGFLAASWACAAVQLKWFGYHYLPMLPFLALVVGLSVVESRLPAEGPRPAFAWVRQALLALAAGFGGLSVVHYATWNAPYWRQAGTLARVRIPEGEPKGDPAAGGRLAIARVIKNRTRPGDRILIWGYEPQLYFETDRRMAGPYCQLLTMAPPWGDTPRVLRLVAKLRREKPALILVASQRHLWHPKTCDKVLEDYPDMAAFIRDHYRKTGKIGDLEFWVRADASAEEAGAGSGGK